jgi:hypothetical protein
MIQWLSLPDRKPFEIAGDIVTQDGGRMLASVCGADLEPLKDLATDTRACQWDRSAAVAALGHVAAWNDERRVVDPRCMAESDLDDVDASPHGAELRRRREHWPPLDDVVRATSWWGCFAKPRKPEPTLVPVRTSPKVGRNAPCPCGSGSKCKKCCGG